MNLLERSARWAPFCRAVWTAPLSDEPDAPDRRIIHSRGVRLAAPVRLERVGVCLGPGYFKCGSKQATDWVTDFRVLAWDGHGWRIARQERGVPRPDRTAVTWFDLADAVASAVLIEARRCNVDGWWPSWNVTTGGLVLEGTMMAAPPPPPDGMLRVTACDLSGLPAGVSAEHRGSEIRYRTPFLEVGFRLRRAAFSYLSLDDEGEGRTQRNLLQVNGFLGFPASLRDYVVQGVRLTPVGGRDVAAFAAYAVEGTTQVSANRVVYEVRLVQVGQTYRLAWEVWPDRLRLTVERTGERPLRAFDSSAWHMAFDSRVTPTTVLGRIIRRGETGLVTLPLLWHAPGLGTLHVAATAGAALWRADSIRPIYTTTGELKVGEEPQAEGDYLLLAGRHRAEIEMVVGAPPLLLANDDAPPAVQRMLRRCALTGLTYRPDTATFSNNGNSMHAPICMDNWSAIATRLGNILPGLKATDLLRDTLERWLDGAPGYASGRTSDGDNLLEDEYLMTGAAALLGLAEYLQAAGEPPWVAYYSRAIRQQIAQMQARDLDGDGLIESPYRLGISGQHQWSTCWFDVLSFGWKDAFTNALLYAALRALADVFPRLGQPTLAAGLPDWAERLRANFLPTFYNPQTGWLAGWRCKADKLHDYAFLFVNGAAVMAGLVAEPLARTIMAKLWDEMARVGYDDFRLGLPGNLWRIPDEDMATVQHGLPFGGYQNGGATHSQARHFINGLYRVGMREEADRVLTGLCASLADGTAFAGCGSGVDWRMWDGSPCGYEGLLCDQFGVLAPAIDRYARPVSAEPVR